MLRPSARNPTEAKNLVDKIIRYDTDPKAALMAEDWSRRQARATSARCELPQLQVVAEGA